MKSVKSQTVIIIFTIATISTLSPCHCNEQLIETTCKKTPHYDLCVQSLKSDPSSSDADVAGLALIMVKIMTGKEKTTIDKVNQLLRNGHLEPKMEKALRYCTELYKDAIDTLPTIEGALQAGDPKFAEEGLISTQNEAQDCEGAFPKGTSPLTKENQNMIDLAVVTEAIVKILL